MNDHGSVNQRILASLPRSDRLRKLESAYRSYPTTFCSPDLKRLYLRFFDITAVNVHYVEVIARVESSLGAAVAEQCEGHLQQRLTDSLESVDTALDGAAALMQANGLTQEAKFLPDGLRVEARVTSPIMRNYLKLMEKTEQLIGLLETLRIDGVITSAQCDERRGAVKKQIKTFAAAVRRVAAELRGRVQSGRRQDKSVENGERSARRSNGAADSVAEIQPASSPINGDATVAQEVIGVMESKLKKRWRNVAPPRDKRAAA